jgi:hypothetical protein
VSFLLFQDRTVVGGRELPDRCRTSGLGHSRVSADCMGPRRLNTLSDSSLTKTLSRLRGSSLNVGSTTADGTFAHLEVSVRPRPETRAFLLNLLNIIGGAIKRCHHQS